MCELNSSDECDYYTVPLVVRTTHQAWMIPKMIVNIQRRMF